MAILNLKENKGRITLASLLVTSLVLTTVGLYAFANTAKAAVLTSMKDTLSTSTPSVVANHTLLFTGLGLAASETIILTLNFDGTPIPTTLDYTDIDFSFQAAPDGVCNTGDTEMTLAAAPVTTTMGVVRTSATVLTFTNGSTAVASGSEICIEIGKNATNQSTGVRQITNASKEGVGLGTGNIKSISISGTFGDTGDALVAIIEGVAVSVTVDESLSFSIVGVTNANCDTSFTTLAGPDTVTTDAAVLFTTVSTTNAFVHACHDLTISTNGVTGYGITAEENQSLLRTGGDSNDKTIDDSLGNAGTMTHAVSDAWSTTTVNGFGYSCVLSTGGQGDCVITAGTNYRQFPCTGAAGVCDPDGGGEAVTTVASSLVPVSAKVSRIEYKLNISGVQPAGAYSNVITYIASPTF